MIWNTATVLDITEVLYQEILSASISCVMIHGDDDGISPGYYHVCNITITRV